MNTKSTKFSIKFKENQFSEIQDIYNSNIEVFVTLQDEFPLTIIVGTPKNLQYLMEKDNMNFYEPGLPWIIVQKLTKEIIEEAVQAYIADKPEGYWLKLYHFADDIDIAVFNKLQAKEIEESAQLNLLIGLDNLKDKIIKLDSLNESKKSDLVTSLEKLYKILNEE